MTSDLDKLLKPPPAHIVSPLHGAHIWKVKLPGESVRKMTSVQFKERYPRLWKHFRGLAPGETRILKLRRRRRKAARVGVQSIHPSQMSMQARARICPWGIRGEMRRLFIEEGMTPAEYRARPEFQLQLKDHQRKTMEEYYANHPEELEWKQRRKERKRKAENRELARKGRPPKIDYAKFINPGQIAKHLDVPPLEVRKFLRKHNIGKRGGRYAFTRKETRIILRAFRKEWDG